MGIRLSEKHGVNPAIPICFYCGKEKNEIILAGRLPNDREAPRKVAWNTEPCDTCKRHMEKGVMFISVKDTDDDEEMKNPYRTGSVCVIRDAGVKKMPFATEVIEDLLTRRVCFLTDEAWDSLGLPRKNIEER